MPTTLPPLQSLLRKVKRRLQPAVVLAYRHLSPRLNLESLNAVLVLGNQKTGSTAVAELLAARGSLSVVTDIPPLQSSDRNLPNDPERVARFLQRARYYFRHDLVKENALTPATEALLEVLPEARFVYVVRHPVHNIRSILDRLGLPGTPCPLHRLDLSEGGWRPIVENRHFDGAADDHITSLARRWVATTTLYRRHANRMNLVQYEEFMEDKVDCIDRLANRLGIAPRQDIQSLLEIPFQPRGQHRSVPPESFFSAKALEIINRECADGMDALDYAPITPAPQS